MSLTLGERFASRFTVLESAGKGGTASVYKAYDQESSRVVALKIFDVDGKDPDIVTEFWNREVGALQRLSHDCIVTMLDAGRDQASSLRFISLEWIEGETLEDYLLRRGKMSWEEFWRSIGSSLLDALVFAAERSVSHRDLSPKNILIQNDVPKVIDFGQAKISTTGIGRTVAGWHTAPYCPPEPDTGRYTYTRDPYALSAICVRAVCGQRLDDHENLYTQLQNADLPQEVGDVIRRSLSRIPEERYRTTIEYHAAMCGDRSGEGEPEAYVIPIRVIPSVLERVAYGDEELTPMESLLAELNDAVSIYPAKGESGAGLRITLETASHRFTADLDGQTQDHLVLIGAVTKRFNLDGLYQAQKWMPEVSFTPKLPAGAQRSATRSLLRSFYQALEESQSEAVVKREHGAVISEWENLLDAFRYVARHEVPELRYTKLEAEGPWLTAYVDNPEDASEDETRTISVDGRWVFRGQIESIRGNACELLSSRQRVNLEGVPARGRLEIDWLQSRIALDRQAKAVEKFSSLDVPAPALGRLLTLEDQGPEEPEFGPVSKFFDATLDAPKKAVVSRAAAASPSLLVTHGPPGTGKTKLIVELLRQELARNPEAKILLVSQTHAALDNALERLLRVDSDVSCVRIGSGSKEADPRVDSCSVEKRAQQLRENVERATKKFIEARAQVLGVDHAEVELGLLVSDVAGLQNTLGARNEAVETLEQELSDIVEQAASADEGSPARSKAQIRASVVEGELDRAKSLIEVAKAEIQHALVRLEESGQKGKQLAKLSESELSEWSLSVLKAEGHSEIGNLLRLSEAWRLRFGQSDDFKTAIISTSSIVAGTCVGFCREEAASRTAFDLCIVDEAGKATTTELLVPLAQARRAIVLGDHHQLPAVIDHSLKSKDLQDRFGLKPEQIDEQIFEKLANELNAGAKAALSTQYRMRGSIGRLVSTCFYEGELTTGEEDAEREAPNLELAGLRKAVTWLDPYNGANRSRKEREVGKSYENELEVRCVMALLARLAFVFSQTLSGRAWPSVGVITGYAPQASLIQSEIRKNPALDRLQVECSTVHAFQGREVDICIYSVVRKNDERKIGMLKEWRHLNVALSRARDYLVVVGGYDFCSRANPPNPFSKIVSFVSNDDGCDLKEWQDA